MLDFTKNTSYSHAAKIVDHIVATDKYLSMTLNRAPHETLNKMLGDLITVLRPVYDANIVTYILGNDLIKNKIQNLRGMLGECEYALEKTWADNIISNGNVYTDYPYMSSYESLVESECKILANYIDINGKSACFIGCGPMPITAFELQKIFPQVTLTCIEMEKEAILLSSDVCKVSEIEMDYMHSKAEEADYAPYDMIFIASMTVNKMQVLKKIQETAKTRTIIAIRTVEDLRHILYEPVNVDEVPAVFKYLDVTPYRAEHLNTTLFFRLEN